MARKSTNMIGQLANYHGVQDLVREQRRDMLKDRQRTLYDEPADNEDEEREDEPLDVFEYMERSMGR